MPSIASHKLVDSLRVSRNQRSRGSIEMGNLGRKRSISLPLKRHRRRHSLQIITPIQKSFSNGLCSMPINLNKSSCSHSTTANGTTPTTAIGATTVAIAATIAAVTTKTITPTEPIEKKDTTFTVISHSLDLDYELEIEGPSFKNEKKSHKSLRMIKRFSKGVRSFFDNYTWILG
jgi:lauroyl/myristoyl acyltransferase